MTQPAPAAARLEPVIGLEIHVQLATASKIFCGCPTRFGQSPNTQICPVCLGLPGVLPVLNRRAVELAVRLALALGGRVVRHSRFARKHYVYPDLPKGYQITQYEEPLATGGTLEIEADDGTPAGIGLERLHLEEDAGKLMHTAQASLIDYNRAGVPLVEIVTEPVLRSPRAARQALKRLRQLVRWLGISDGNMEEGSLRCDANVSLRATGTAALGVKTELKNLNSFRHVERALDFEIGRQTTRLAGGGRVLPETRLWDEARGETRPMRAKEAAHDYRYLPEPDLGAVRLEASRLDAIRRELPELPLARERRYVAKLGLGLDDARLLAGARALGDYFEATLAAHADARRVAGWLRTEILAILRRTGGAIEDFPVPPAALAGLLDHVGDGRLSDRQAKEVLAEMVASGRPAAAIVAERGLEQLRDVEEIRAQVGAVLAAHPAQLADYLGGKRELRRFFMGQLMRRTGGRVHPQSAERLLVQELEARRSARRTT